MILNILTVLFFVLGFALLFWMIVERRRDVLHYVTKTSRARLTMPADLRAQTSLAKQSRIVRYTEGKSEMSTAGLQELEELDALGVKLLATARELPRRLRRPPNATKKRPRNAHIDVCGSRRSIRRRPQLKERCALCFAK